jgi:trehalose 6-phosphate synthase/phosphatase
MLKIMKSLIIISNRLPFVVGKNDKGQAIRLNSGEGFENALAPLVVKSNGYWIGGAGKECNNNNNQDNGFNSSTIPESDDPTSISHELKSSQIVPVVCDNETYRNFYNGMCCESLWPLMHSLPSIAGFNIDYWTAYVEVNEQYATLALETLITIGNTRKTSAKGHIVWIHDYHLQALPMMLKNLVEAAQILCKIAFFMHIPFPSWDIFRLNPWAKEMLLGLLGCDIIAFHTYTYAINFLDCCFK